MKLALQFKALGDQGIQIIFGTEISETTCLQIQAMSKLLEQQKHLPILTCVPAYTTLSVYYDAHRISYTELVHELTDLSNTVEQLKPHQPYIYEIPTTYGGEFGPDLLDVANFHRLEPEAVIQIHSENIYFIYMLGFTPGFPYLGGQLERIATPRLAEPRAKVAAGSVGLAGAQTGIYPLESPGGWRIIGRTPVQLYRPQHEQPFLLEAGHYVRFVPISAQEYSEIVQLMTEQPAYAWNSYPHPSFQ